MRRLVINRSDRGASLILVLIIVAVVGGVMGAVLDQTDTNVRATVNLRDVAADTYSADSGVEAALTLLKSSSLSCENPASAAGVALGSSASPFYPDAGGNDGALNAYAKCTPDPTNGVTSSASQPPPVTTTNTVTPAPVTVYPPGWNNPDPTLPGYALLVTGTGSQGLDVSRSANSTNVCIENGSIASAGNINASGMQSFAVALAPAYGNGHACVNGTGTDKYGNALTVTASNSNGCTGGAIFTPTPCQSAVTFPGFPSAPSITDTASPVKHNPVATCYTATVKSQSTTFAAFWPGYYDGTKGLAILNSPCGSSTPSYEWFQPGTYYFDLPSGSDWNWGSGGRMIGGTPIDSSGTKIAGLDAKTPSTLTALSNVAAAPASCLDPNAAGAGSITGVDFVVGNGTKLDLTATRVTASAAQFCANGRGNTSMPVVFDYLKSSLPVTTDDGAKTLLAGTDCATTCGTSNADSLFQYTNSSGQPQFYFSGYFYAPTAGIYISIKNTSGQVFQWGLVIQNLNVQLTGSAPSTGFVGLPAPVYGVQVQPSTSQPPPVTSTSTSTPPAVDVPVYTVRYVYVWICQVTQLVGGQCPTTGSANVRVRVGWTPGDMTMKILGWNNLN